MNREPSTYQLWMQVARIREKKGDKTGAQQARKNAKIARKVRRATRQSRLLPGHPEAEVSQMAAGGSRTEKKPNVREDVKPDTTSVSFAETGISRLSLYGINSIDVLLEILCMR